MTIRWSWHELVLLLFVFLYNIYQLSFLQHDNPNPASPEPAVASHPPPGSKSKTHFLALLRDVPIQPAPALLPLIVEPRIDCKVKTWQSVSDPVDQVQHICECLDIIISRNVLSNNTWGWNRFFVSKRACLKRRVKQQVWNNNQRRMVVMWRIKVWRKSYFINSCFSLFYWAAVQAVKVWHTGVLAVLHDKTFI